MDNQSNYNNGNNGYGGGGYGSGGPGNNGSNGNNNNNGNNGDNNNKNNKLAFLINDCLYVNLNLRMKIKAIISFVKLLFKPSFFLPCQSITKVK